MTAKAKTAMKMKRRAAALHDVFSNAGSRPNVPITLGFLHRDHTIRTGACGVLAIYRDNTLVATAHSVVEAKTWIDSLRHATPATTDETEPQAQEQLL